MASKVFIILSLLFCSTLGAQHIPTITLDTYDELKTSTEGNYLILADNDRTLTFNDIVDTVFYPMSLDSLENSGAKTYWFQFQLDIKTESKYILLDFGFADHLQLYVPESNGYQVYRMGLYGNGEPSTNLSEKNKIVLNTSLLDVTKPFFYRKSIISDKGSLYFSKQPQAAMTDQPDLLFVEKKTAINIDNFLLGSIFVSFLLFFVNYLVSNNKSFLIYTAYLFCVCIYYFNQTSIFYNWLVNWSPLFHLYIDQTASIANRALYFGFAIHFLHMHKSHPRAFKFSTHFLKLFLLIGAVGLCIILIDPYQTIHIGLLLYLKLVFVAISFGIFIYLSFQKFGIPERIVLMGSLFLIIGSTIALILDRVNLFLPIVLFETLLFNWAVNFKSKQLAKDRLNKHFSLIAERNEKRILQELDKTKSRFITNISHEFKTPLTLITGPLQRIREHHIFKKNDVLNKDIGIVIRNSTRLNQLTDQLLSLVKLESGKLENQSTEVQVRDFFEMLLSSISSLAIEKNQSFEYSLPSKNLLVEVDIDKLEKIVLNLLSNAIKFTPENGAVSTFIAYKNEDIDQAELLIQIIDNGIGMSEDEVKQVFDRFYRSPASIENQIEGAGIGLSLAKELVEIMRGTITVKSELEKGTTFEVTIPIKKISERVISSSSQSNELDHQFIGKNQLEDSVLSPNGEQPIILIVEDNDDLRYYIKSTLNSQKYKFIEAKNGVDGFELAQKYIPDVVITDVMMPKMNGIELCERLKKETNTSHIPLLMLTANASLEGELIGLQTGADDYITKPFDPELLELKIDNQLQAQTRLREKLRKEWIVEPHSGNKLLSSEDDFLDKLRSLVDNHLRHPSLNVDFLAKEMGTSRAQLYRKTITMTGLPPSEFIRVIRLKEAEKAFSEGVTNISNVAYAVGFNNLSYFTRCFKEMFGDTPSDYSKKMLASKKS